MIMLDMVLTDIIAHPRFQNFSNRVKRNLFMDPKGQERENVNYHQLLYDDIHLSEIQ